MPAYSYIAFNADGKKQSGYISANSEREARNQLIVILHSMLMEKNNQAILVLILSVKLGN